jgi:hypothetical protein
MAEKQFLTPKQRQEIGYMRKLLGLPEDTYRDMLAGFGAESSKELMLAEASELLARLRTNGIQAGVFKPTKQYVFNKYKYNSYMDRGDCYASPAQLRKIEAIWFRVSRQEDDKARETALRSFIERITGKMDIRVLLKSDASKIINALEKMKENDNGKKKD